jgi:pyruvate formate lyase activating enzyme
VLHAAFLAELLPKAKAAGLHVTIETSGEYRFDALEGLLPYLDLVLYDVKAGGHERHLKLVGHDDRQIQSNLEALLARAPEHGVEVEVRMPVIPGLNDGIESVELLAARLRELGVVQLTLLPYNHLWEAKLPRLDTPREALGIGAHEHSYYEALADRFGRLGIDARVQ